MELPQVCHATVPQARLYFCESSFTGSGMNKKILFIGAAGIAVLAAAAIFHSDPGNEHPAGTFIDPSDQALVARGKDVYTNHCARCHGDRMQGQAEWRKRHSDGKLPAPPHDATGHTWHHPDDILIDIVKNGLVPGRTAPDGYKSDMPSFAKMLSDADIIAALAYIKTAWPADILAQQRNMSVHRHSH